MFKKKAVIVLLAVVLSFTVLMAGCGKSATDEALELSKRQVDEMNQEKEEKAKAGGYEVGEEPWKINGFPGSAYQYFKEEDLKEMSTEQLEQIKVTNWLIMRMVETTGESLSALEMNECAEIAYYWIKERREQSKEITQEELNKYFDSTIYK